MKTVFDEILEVAQDQMGLFRSSQIDAERQYIHHYVQSGRIINVMRGIYRVTHFPPNEREDLMVAYLWSEQEGIISHETALSLYELSDALPRKLHITVPLSWKNKRRKTPGRFTLHYADIAPVDAQWFGAVPMTTVERTFVDLFDIGFDPHLFDQALEQAIHRGLVTSDIARRLLYRLVAERSEELIQ